MSFSEVPQLPLFFETLMGLSQVQAYHQCNGYLLFRRDPHAPFFAKAGLTDRRLTRHRFNTSLNLMIQLRRSPWAANFTLEAALGSKL